jgi:hypothetical protein
MSTNAEQTLFDSVKNLIVQLRRGKNTQSNWNKFKNLVESNIDEICQTFSTRWLVSICDTYVDYGNEIERRNALFISLITNMEKLFLTRVMMYDLVLNPNKVEALKKKKTYPLWDGMTSFNIIRGDMTINLFRRIRSILKVTPTLGKIFEMTLNRITINDTFLSDLNKYHHRLLREPTNSELLIIKLRKIINRKIAGLKKSLSGNFLLLKD